MTKLKTRSNFMQIFELKRFDMKTQRRPLHEHTARSIFIIQNVQWNAIRFYSEKTATKLMIDMVGPIECVIHVHKSLCLIRSFKFHHLNGKCKSNRVRPNEWEWARTNNIDGFMDKREQAHIGEHRQFVICCYWQWWNINDSAWMRVCLKRSIF